MKFIKYNNINAFCNDLDLFIKVFDKGNYQYSIINYGNEETEIEIVNKRNLYVGQVSYRDHMMWGWTSIISVRDESVINVVGQNGNKIDTEEEIRNKIKKIKKILEDNNYEQFGVQFNALNSLNKKSTINN